MRWPSVWSAVGFLVARFRLHGVADIAAHRGQSGTGFPEREVSGHDYTWIRPPRSLRLFSTRRVMRIHVLVQNIDKLGHNCVAAQSNGQLAIDINRRYGLFKCAGQRDAQIGVFGFARAIHNAAHHGDFHGFNARVAFLPARHAFPQVRLDLIRHVLEECAGSPAATRARGNLRGEAADAERLQNLLAYDNFFGAIAIRQGRKRGADRIANTFLKQNRKRRSGGHDSFRAEARFRQTEM